jgi:hypothetical protein
MKYVNTREAKTQPSKRKKPRLGTGKDRVILRPGWDSPQADAEIEAMFDVLKEADDR